MQVIEWISEDLGSLKGEYLWSEKGWPPRLFKCVHWKPHSSRGNEPAIVVQSLRGRTFSYDSLADFEDDRWHVLTPFSEEP